MASSATWPGRAARVVSAQRGLFTVNDGQGEAACFVAGRIRHSQAEDYPVTGDWVVVRQEMIQGVLPRQNMLARGRSGSRGRRMDAAWTGQPIAANLDTVFVVCGLDRDFNLRRLERYLTLVYNAGISPVVVLTKADLHADAASFCQEAEAIAPGVPVVATSARDGRGRAELESWLSPGRTVAMIGSSGAGKSTLANLLHGSEIQTAGDVGSGTGKGRHTTTVRELLRMPQGGLLMDNPGIREIALWEGDQGTDDAFPDIRELARHCRFADCSHGCEPGCAVLQAVERGTLPLGRLESYRKLQRELRYACARQEKGADRVEKERWKGISRHARRLKR